MAKILEQSPSHLLVLMYRRKIRMTYNGGQSFSCAMEPEGKTMDPQEFYDEVVVTLDWNALPSPRPVLTKKNFGEDLCYADVEGRIRCNAVHGGKAGVYEQASELMPVLEGIRAWFQTNGLGSS